MWPHTKTATAVLEACDGFVGPAQTPEPLRLPFLKRKAHRRGKCVPVAVASVLLFIVALSCLFISTCKTHGVFPLRKAGDLESSRLLQRKLSVSDWSDGPPGAKGMEFRPFPTSMQPEGIATRIGQYKGVRNSSFGFASSLTSIDIPAGRRLSQSSSDNGDESSSSEQGSHGMVLESLVHELCAEASADDFFRSLLELERAEEDVGSGQYAGRSGIVEHEMNARPELHDILLEAAISAEILAPLDASVTDHMDPGTLPSKLIPDEGQVSETFTDVSESFSDTLAQLLTVSPLPPVSEEGASAESFQFGAVSLTSDSEGVQYAQLLWLWQSYTGSSDSSPTRMSPTGATVGCVLSLEAMEGADDSEREAMLPSTETIDHWHVPASSAIRVGFTREETSRSEELYVSEHGAVQSSGSVLEGLVGETQSSAPLELVTEPWDADTLSFGYNGAGQYTKLRVDKLRALLSSAHLTYNESVRALLLGKQILQEMYPYSLKSNERRAFDYRTLASQLVHMVIRLDTLLWLSAVFPEVTRPHGWWPKLVDYSNLRDSWRSDLHFDSKYKAIVERCIECLRLLAEQRRPLPQTIDWIMLMFKRHVSRSRKPKYVTLGEAELAAETEPNSSENTQSHVESQSATEAQLQTQQESMLLGVSMHMGTMASESMYEDPLSGKKDHMSKRRSTHTAQGGEEIRDSGCREGDGVEHAKVVVQTERTEPESTHLESHVSPQRPEWFCVSSLTNVTHVVDRKLVEPELEKYHLWNIDAEDIGVSFNPRYSIVYPSEASWLLAQRKLSLADSIKLLSLGRKIVRILRPIAYSSVQDPRWKEHSRARTLSLLVIQIDTLLRISNLFPNVTQRHAWWPIMVQKCNLRIPFMSGVNRLSVHSEIIETSTEALNILLQQTRPDARIIKYIYTYYQNLLTRQQAKHKK